jgi:hypothetical protein
VKENCQRYEERQYDSRDHDAGIVDRKAEYAYEQGAHEPGPQFGIGLDQYLPSATRPEK